MQLHELQSLESWLLKPLSIPVIGRCLQKKAVIALAEDNSPDAVKVLAKAVTCLKDEEIKDIVLDALGKIRNQSCIDAFCQVWADTRHRDLTNLLVKKNWVASAPVNVRVLTALKAKQLQVVTNVGKEIVEPLLSALKDRDTEIANRASECAVAFINSDVIDYICQKWVKNRDKLLEQIIVKAKYTAGQPAEIRVISELKVLGKIPYLEDLSYHRSTIIEFLLRVSDPIEFLVKAFNDRDSEIAESAKECALNLYNDCGCGHYSDWNQQRIAEGLCEKWAETRDQLLEELICKGKYIYFLNCLDGYSKNNELFVLTALKTAELEVIKHREKIIVEPLLKAFNDRDSEIAERARECAISLTNPEAIDYICDKWSKTRDQLLEELICQGKYVAQQPVELRVLTALKIDKQNTIVNQGTEVIIPLLEAYQDNDQVIVTNAFSALKNMLENEKAQQFLASLIEEPQNQIAREFALAINFTPGNPNQKALFYFLTEQWVKYESLDFEYTLLKTSYQNGTEQLRRLIAQKIKQAGRFEWLKILASGNQKKRLGEMTDAEWETTLVVLKSGKQWEAMWQLAQKAPTIWSKQLLQGLKKVKWLPKAEHEQVVFERLKQLADKCSENLSFMGKLTSNLTNFMIPGWTNSVDQISFSPDGKILASYENSYGERAIRLWKIPDGKPIATLTGHIGSINGMSFSPDGKILASYSSDKTIRLWQMPDGKPIATLTGHIDGISFSPNGQLLASYGGKKTINVIRLWQMPTGKLLSTLSEPFYSSTYDIHNNNPCRIKGLTFTPNEEILASFGDGVIRLWSSGMFQPSRLPIKHLSQQKRDWIEKALQDNEITKEEKHWLEFMQALMDWHQRFDVEVEDAPQLVSTGEFDIEIEG